MAFSDSKPHYALLDGLRGVAAMLVVWYHVFEGFQFAGNKPVIDFIPNRSLENDKKLFLMTAIRKTALYMLDS